MRSTAAHVASAGRRLHRDERGTITILSVFAAMGLTMVLGMVMNTGRQVDGKIRMQDAADSAAYSGGLVLARGMNTLALTNHMLCDVFALTAFLREGRDRNAEKKVPPILDAWNKAGQAMAKAKISDSSVHGLRTLSRKIPAAGNAILAKVPHEQELVRTYSEWAAAAAEKLLPLCEDILRYEMIPEYQRAVVEAIPDVAQRAALEVARRHGQPEQGRGPMLAVLWGPSGAPVAGGGGMSDRALPVVDPVLDSGMGGKYLEIARKKRHQRAHRYLEQLNNEAMWVFDHPAQFSQFDELWRGYTRGNLMRLLEQEYPFNNLPHVIRTHEWEVNSLSEGAAVLDGGFTFIAVVYAKQVPEMLSGLFVNPIEGDALTFAEVRLFVPWRRLQFWSDYSGGSSSPSTPFERASGGSGGSIVGWHVGRQEWRTIDENYVPPGPCQSQSRFPKVDTSQLPDKRNAWDLFNQSWAVQLVPATHDSLAAILQTAPPLPELSDFKPPKLGLTSQDIRRISMH